MLVCKKILIFCAFACCGTLFAQNIQNPVLPGVADAGVMKYNGKYYIGGVFTNGDFYVSDDLVHWGKPVHVVTMDNGWSKGSGAGNEQIHANDMFCLNGDFHLYWSVNYWGKDKHAVHIVHAQSKNVLGPYIEPDKKTWMDNRIDPKVFKDDDGQLYMYMVRFTDGNTIWGRKMKNPAEFAGEPVCLFASLPDTWETMDNRVAEGPWVMKYRDRYYLMYNANHTSTEWGNYQLGVAEADSPLSFQNGNKYSYPVVNSNQILLEENYLEQIVPIFAFSSKSYVTDICRLALSNIERFVTSDFYIDRIKHISQLEYRCLAGQKLEGDLDIIVGFASVGEQTAIVDIANEFSHSNIANLGIEVYDAIGEFTNCISGLFATALSKKGSMLEITPQFAYENQFAKGDAYVLPIHIHDSEVLLFISASDETKAGDMPVVRKIMAKAGGEVTLDSKGTVVIVDDSGMSRKILRDILEEAGYAVLAEATDGLEGVLAYKTYYPDIITLDITMPNMDGTEALKEIKAYDSNAKVIMITAAGQQHKVIEALKLGAERFITKPFDKEEILKNIEEVLEG